jgi:MIP family channel proteins
MARAIAQQARLAPLEGGGTLTLPGWVKKAGAEAVGTFALVFVGCGAIVVNAQTGALGHAGVALAFGAVVAIMITATAHVSGAHLNPAVTLAFASTGQLPLREVPAYLGAQLGAAIAGAFAVATVIGQEASVGATSFQVSVDQAFLIEATITFGLMFVISSVAADESASGGSAGILIGGTVGLAALVAGPLTGASMNPARSLGPALLANAEDQWLYAIAPCVGAVLGAWSYQVVRLSKTPRADDAA